MGTEESPPNPPGHLLDWSRKTAWRGEGRSQGGGLGTSLHVQGLVRQQGADGQIFRWPTNWQCFFLIMCVLLIQAIYMDTFFLTRS